MVPLLSVTDIVKREVVLASPEERRRVEPLATAQHVLRGRLSLALSHDPMLDANILASQRIGPSRYISSGEDLRNAGFKILVHQHPVVGFDARSVGQLGLGFDADPDHYEVGCDRLAILKGDSVRTYRGNALLEMELYAVAFVQLTQVFAHLWSKRPFHRHSLGRYDLDFQFPLDQRRSDLHCYKTRSDQDDALGRGRPANDRAAVTQRTQIINMRRARARNLEPHGCAAGRKKQRIIFALMPVAKLDTLRARIYRRDAGI